MVFLSLFQCHKVQIMNLRLVASGVIPKPALKRLPRGDGDAEPVGEIEVYMNGGWRTVPLYERATLLAGQRLHGPAVIAQADTTSCLPDGFAGAVDDHGNIILHPTAGDA